MVRSHTFSEQERLSVSDSRYKLWKNINHHPCKKGSANEGKVFEWHTKSIQVEDVAGEGPVYKSVPVVIDTEAWPSSSYHEPEFVPWDGRLAFDLANQVFLGEEEAPLVEVVNGR
jgi:hypothetical protein